MAVRDARGARRRATAAAIERAALRQAVDNGSAAVTVDSICEEALISARTFYNYFSTRDAVLAGQRWNSVSPDAADRFRADDSSELLERLILLFVESGPQTADERELFQLRQRLFEREPAWAEQAMVGFAECVDEVVDLVCASWEASGRSITTEPDLAEVARLTVMLVGSVLHHALLAQPSPDSGEPASADRLLGLARRAISGLTT